MVKLNSEELEILKSNSANLSSARIIADQITKDPTLGGVFPNGDKGNFENVDHEKFKDKWCGWWSLAEILLKIAKVFTGEKGDKAIDRILEIGGQVCVEDM